MTGKNAIIFIDTESGLEGPWREYLDFAEGISQITKVLHRYKVPAVFNCCGKLLELHPQLVMELEKQGHEIALHGWKHENLRMLDDKWLEKVLTRSHQAYIQTLGHSPYGFRAPWLDYDQRLLEWLNRKGYLWISHQHIFFRERFFSPAARPEIQAGQRVAGLWARWQERNFCKLPHQNKFGLKELPLTSSMDGELLGLVSPLQPSPAKDLDFAVNAWHQQLLRAPNFFTLNLHDWLIASGNRTDVLNKMVSLLLSQDYKITTARQII